VNDSASEAAKNSVPNAALFAVNHSDCLDVTTIAPAHGAVPKPYDNLKKAIGLLPP
jgi:hypothetical protein